ncbi:MAG: hypothetical protein OXC06_00910, partial [Acidimicrobiaceae bacterium]|nr:hypothetical protein [Acidimicrobiaceae bacterium]
SAEPACSYWVRHKKTADDSWSSWADTGWTSGPPAHTVTGLDGGTSYDFQIERREGTGQSQVALNQATVSATPRIPVEVSVAPWPTVGVFVFGSNFSSTYATRDGGGLFPGDTHTPVVSGNRWEASGSLAAQFCAVPASGDLSGIDGTSGCVDASPATVATGAGGDFAEVGLTYTVPGTGVPEHGVAVRISGTDSQGDSAAAVVEVIHAAARIDVTVKTVVRGGETSATPESEDLRTLAPGDTAVFTAVGSGWLVVPSMIMCRVPEGGRDAQDALRQLNGRNYVNFCDSGSVVGGLTPITVTEGMWTEEVTYTVPVGGVAPYGIALSAGDRARIQGLAVEVVPRKADTDLPSLQAAEKTTAQHRANNQRVFEVTGSGWTAGGEIAPLPLNGEFPQGPVQAEFCTIPDGGLDAIADAHCDTANAVTVTVPTEAPVGVTGWTLGDLAATEMVYAIPEGGIPDGGVAIRVSRLVPVRDIGPQPDETHLTAAELQGPIVLESKAVAIPAAAKVLEIVPNQTTRVYGDTEDLGFTVRGLDTGDAVG